MQRARLEEELSVLASRLAQFPRLVVEASGRDALSSRNWFRIRDRLSGRFCTLKASHPNDFLGPRFDAWLERYLRDL